MLFHLFSSRWYLPVYPCSLFTALQLWQKISQGEKQNRNSLAFCLAFVHHIAIPWLLPGPLAAILGTFSWSTVTAPQVSSKGRIWRKIITTILFYQTIGSFTTDQNFALQKQQLNKYFLPVITTLTAILLFQSL